MAVNGMLTEGESLLASESPHRRYAFRMLAYPLVETIHYTGLAANLLSSTPLSKYGHFWHQQCQQPKAKLLASKHFFFLQSVLVTFSELLFRELNKKNTLSSTCSPSHV